MVQYRKASIEDLDILIQIRMEFLLEINPEPEKAVLDELINQSRTYFIASLPGEQFIAYIAHEDEKITGIVGICFYREPPRIKNISGKKAYIMNLYVRPGFRRRGIAKHLFELILEQSKSKGYDHISLKATEMGRPLYERYGFKENSEYMEYIIS